MWVCDFGMGWWWWWWGLWCQTGYIPDWVTLAFCGVTVSWLPGSAVMISSWQMLRRVRAATVLLEFLSILFELC
jgi:hypothetical protein